LRSQHFSALTQPLPPSLQVFDEGNIFTAAKIFGQTANNASNAPREICYGDFTHTVAMLVPLFQISSETHTVNADP
jgi:hypothetical protein